MITSNLWITCVPSYQVSASNQSFGIKNLFYRGKKNPNYSLIMSGHLFGIKKLGFGETKQVLSSCSLEGNVLAY